jgi:hypothetical protein
MLLKLAKEWLIDAEINPQAQKKSTRQNKDDPT